jgi:hypothetical protein
MEAMPTKAQIPLVNVLQSTLLYGDGGKHCKTFRETIIAFRENFTTRTGVPANQLIDWEAKEHQEGLEELTNSFLSKEGNTFWPSDSSSQYWNGLTLADNCSL